MQTQWPQLFAPGLLLTPAVSNSFLRRSQLIIDMALVLGQPSALLAKLQAKSFARSLLLQKKQHTKGKHAFQGFGTQTCWGCCSVLPCAGRFFCQRRLLADPKAHVIFAWCDSTDLGGYQLLFTRSTRIKKTMLVKAMEIVFAVVHSDSVYLEEDVRFFREDKGGTSCNGVGQRMERRKKSLKVASSGQRQKAMCPCVSAKMLGERYVQSW